MTRPDPDAIVLWVAGTPATQGSKTGIVVGGRAVIVEGKGPGRERHKAWRTDVAAEARRWASENGLAALLDGPVMVRLRFNLTKPASAPKRRRTWPTKARSGDVDKLARSVLDAITGTLITDDARVVHLDVLKDWGNPPGVWVLIQPVDESVRQIVQGGPCIIPDPANDRSWDGMTDAEAAAEEATWD